jgi:hypothetical protein
MDFNTIIGRLSALGRKKKLILLSIGLAGLLILVVALAFGTFVLDWVFRLPLGVRTFLALGSAVAIAVFAVRRLIKPLGERQTTDGLALMVERSDPSLKDRLISALQLKRDLDAGRAVESPELIKVTVDGAVTALAQRRFSGAVSFAPAVKPAMAATLLCVLAAGAWAAFPDTARIWLNRIVLLRDVPWPKATDLEVQIVDADKFSVTEEDGRTVISMPERTPLQVRVIAHRKVPDEVELVTAPTIDFDAPNTFAMGRPAGKQFFQHIFPPLSQQMFFYAVGGDDTDQKPLFEIRVARAPRIQRFWVDYEYPAYTGLKPRTLPDANIAAPEGTKLSMHFAPNMPLLEFEMILEKAGNRALQIGADGTYTTTLVLEKSDFYTYRLKGDNGINSVDVPRHVLTCEPDQLPRVQIDLPATNSLLCTPNAVIPLRGIATDDYGVTSIAVRSGTGEDAFPREKRLSGDDLLTPLPARKATFYRDLLVSDFLPGAAAPESGPAKPETGDPAVKAEHDRFRFKLLVTDNRSTPSQPEPHRQFGDYEYSVQVVSAADVERELAQRQARLRERVTEIVQLAEARKGEAEQLLESLQSTTAPNQKTLNDRLATIESGQSRVTSELAGTTRQFQRVFDGYLYNRLDPNNLTEKLLVVMASLYRSTADVDPFKLYGEALATVRPQANETELMGRLTLILDLFIRCAAERSPEVSRRLAQANLVLGKADAVSFLRGAVEMQKLLIEDLKSLESKLEAWEDYLDIVQGFKDLLDLQKGIRKKAEQLTK